ncbi:hypothetical protein L7F22_013803 [Adiantum nelumboides]|nr:hypothetical protein [Adiantum nelumboides]
MEDVAPRRRRAQRSPTPTKWKRSPHSPHRHESKREEKSSRKKKERKRSPSSSSDESSGYSSQEKQRRGHQRSYAAWKRSSKLKKFKEGGKNISFLTYDRTFGATDKVLAFIQQFDAAFGDEGFTKSSKLHHVARHFQKSAMVGVGTHMGDHELEEGEACDEPDISCDPDTDFSYLDEKLSVVLGDQQKCFEGGVSAEKLGSKFGGYGSFLPTQERPLLILHQDKPASVLASDASCRTKTNEGIELYAQEIQP